MLSAMEIGLNENHRDISQLYDEVSLLVRVVETYFRDISSPNVQNSFEDPTHGFVFRHDETTMICLLGDEYSDDNFRSRKSFNRSVNMP